MRTYLKTRVLFALTLGVAACGSATEPTTGLSGSVTRGPISPVCTVNVPCDAPFAAHFTVQRGNHIVATFASDSTGAFVVLLEPGNYTITPNADAPVISPSAQAKQVTVQPAGLTAVQLEFDTGIR